MRYVIALDQGTTSSRSILYDERLNAIDQAQREFTQHFPSPGWVEHDAEEIWETQWATLRDLLERNGLKAGDIAALGITNQLPAGDFAIAGDADFVRHALLRQALLGGANHADLGDRVDAVREKRVRRLGELVEHVARRKPPLLHAGGGQCGEANDIAGRVDVRDGRLEIFVHLQATALIGCEAGCGQVQR